MLRRILLVSEEIAGFAGSGGIGSAFEELAVCLANNGYQVDFIIYPVQNIEISDFNRLSTQLARNRIRLLSVDWQKYITSNDSYEKKVIFNL